MQKLRDSNTKQHKEKCPQRVGKYTSFQVHVSKETHVFCISTMLQVIQSIISSTMLLTSTTSRQIYLTSILCI